ncbi:MAG: glycosyltransferase family 25 protein [Planctomycetia bacterium]|nr:glycosyltransferase family 25 protein [Planctomycetia bacterium]
MKCYVLNLDRSKDRYDVFLNNFSHTKLEVERIVAVEGRELSEKSPEFSVWRYQYLHGQHFNGSVFGCAMSHLKAMTTFLATEDSHAMICEDDVTATPDLDRVLTECMRYRKSWDLL